MLKCRSAYANYYQEIVSIEPTLPIQEETTAFKERICHSTSSNGTAHKKDLQHKDQAKEKASLQPLSIQQNNTPCAISIKDQNQTVKQHKQKLRSKTTSQALQVKGI